MSDLELIAKLANALSEMIEAVENQYDPGCCCYDERELLALADRRIFDGVA